MYIPDHFRQDDRETLTSLIRDYGFGLLISVVDGSPFVSHIPFLVDGDSDGLVLRGHVARANPHWRSLGNDEVLAVFQGPHAYVTPTWYRSRGVPTWNYTAVHAYGRARVVQDVEELHRIVLDLSDQNENNFEDPWIPDYEESMLNAIIGLEIEVERIEGKFKISQNKDTADREGVVRGLKGVATDEADALVAIMDKYYK